MTFDRADQLAEVVYEYQWADDLRHHSLVQSPDDEHERALYRREEARRGEQRQDVMLSSVIHEARGKFGGEKDRPVLPLLLDRETHLVTKIMNEDTTSVKNIVGDKRYLSYPHGLPGIFRMQEVTAEEVSLVRQSTTPVFVYFTIYDQRLGQRVQGLSQFLVPVDLGVTTYGVLFNRALAKLKQLRLNRGNFVKVGKIYDENTLTLWTS